MVRNRPLRKKVLLLFALFLVPSLLFSDGGLQLPEVTRDTLDNGLRVYHIQDELPRCIVVAKVRFGILHEDRDTAGLADMMAKSLSQGGTEEHPGPELNRYIEAMGGRLSIQASYESITVAVTMLSRYREEAFDLVRQVLLEPALEKEHVDLARSLLLEKIKRRYDRPEAIAFDTLKEVIYDGKGYGAIAGKKTLETMDSDYLRKRWRSMTVGGNIQLAISMKGGAKEGLQMAKSSFSGLRKGEELSYTMDTSKIEERVSKYRDSIILVPRDLPQSTVVQGTLAPPAAHDSYYDLSVMNYLLGGGTFTSRLMQEIRVKRGLAYSVASVLRMRKEGGLFLAYAQTRVASTGKVLDLMNGSVDSMVTSPPEGETLGWAKRALVNRYVFQFETATEVLGNYLEADYYGLGPEYLMEYRERIAGVDRAELVKSTRKLLEPGRVTVVVGPESLKEELSGRAEIVVRGLPGHAQ
jgi:zinc protease